MAFRACMSPTSIMFPQQCYCVSSFSSLNRRVPKLVRSTQLRLYRKVSEAPISRPRIENVSPLSSSYVREVPQQAAEEVRARSVSGSDSAESSSEHRTSFRQSMMQSVQTVVTVMRKVKTFRLSPNEDMMDTMDAIADQLGVANILLQLVSDEIDPKTGTGKRSAVSKLGDWWEKANVTADKVQYTANFELAQDFGTPGAITVRNYHQNEFYLDSVTLHYSGRSKDVYFPCQFWVQPARLSPAERIFFSNKAYLPSETPAGLRELREMELKALRGDGKGVREHDERIYDYAVYNDLGDPDVSLHRPILGGSNDLPYPRRCRTGRPPSKVDPACESRTAVGGTMYVPRDENFDPIKEATFVGNCMKGLLHKLAPKVLKTLTETNLIPGVQFNSFEDIDKLYSSVRAVATLTDRRLNESGAAHDVFSAAGLGFPKGPGDFFKQLPFIGRSPDESDNRLDINYPLPEIVSKDKFAWIRDEEFGRQMLAGQNPSSLECLKVFPPVSELDPTLYGPRKSAMTAEHLECHLDGFTLQQALDQKKIFLLDYHDLFMPFIHAINGLEGRRSYASRTVLYLRKDGVLRPVAIELSLPPGPDGFPGSQRVFTPGDEHTNYWLWTLAKAHVCSNDAGHHQLVSHWLRGHAATEPYVIATHRQLSFMHPIAMLLRPHLRYTMEINRHARQTLISADGIIQHNLGTSDADPLTKLFFKVLGSLSLESYFTPGKHCMEMSSAAYKTLWRFDMEALPADLIRRGMAEEDKCAPHGLKLTIEDYPFAADGLLLWSAIESWVSEYVSIYYRDSSAITSDAELQTWWAEIRLVGHADKKHEPWWSKLNTKEDLIHILTTMIWITSGHHAAMNFGQFAYSGYFPNRPSLTRRLIPEEHEPEYQELLKNPQSFYLSTIPNQEQATVMMMMIEVLSAHSPDEEYLGQRRPRWTNDKEALVAFGKFASMMMDSEKEIEARNRNPTNKNRNGAGIPPYELLFSRSGPGITGKGVPNSVSI